MLKFKTRRKRVPLHATKPMVASEKEQLIGTVRGMKASDLEERFAAALDQRRRSVDGYYFRLPVNAPRGMPGWKELDFLVISRGYHPIQIDDVTFVHKGQRALAQDKLNDVIIMNALASMSPRPIRHIPSTRLGDKDAAMSVVKELFG